MKLFAQIISIIFHPVFIPLYCAVIFVNSLPYSILYSTAYKILIIAVIAFFTCGIPILVMLFKYLNGSISDFYIKERKKRTPIYIISFVCCVICAVNLINLHIEPFFLFIFASSSMSIFVLAAINMKWKISAHSCGAGILCGTVFASAYYLFANPVFLFCSVIFISGTVISARLALNAHTVGQTTAGFFVGLIFSLLPIIIIIL